MICLMIWQYYVHKRMVENLKIVKNKNYGFWDFEMVKLMILN